MTTSTDFARCLELFFSEYLTHDRNVSANTVASYRDAFVGFVQYMAQCKKVPADSLCLEMFTRESVLQYLRWLVDEKKVSPQTRNYRLAALRSFCNYLQYRVVERMKQWQEIRVIPPLKTTVKSFEYLTTEGLKLLLEQPDGTTPKGRRHLAILSLMYDTGARVQEVADLTVGSLRITSEPYTIRIVGKGNKTRIVPLSKEAAVILKEYMNDNATTLALQTSPLFQNNRGEKLSRKGISHILSVYADMARALRPDLIPEKLSPHAIRHTRGMHLLQGGVHIVHVRDFLGHVSIKTTDIYVRADSKAKREALEKAYRDTIPSVDTEREWERNKDLLGWLKGLGR